MNFRRATTFLILYLTFFTFVNGRSSFSRRSENENDEFEEKFLQLRAAFELRSTTGAMITLKNRAAMNIRMRVLFINGNGSATLAETGLLTAGRTKSITLPIDAKNGEITIEKDMFFETWRPVFKDKVKNGTQCIKITGTTFFSKVRQC